MNVSENVRNGECHFFPNEGGIKSFLCKKYWYFTKLLGGWYSFEIVKMWLKVDVSKSIYDGECNFFEIKEWCKVSCVKIFC